MEHPEGPVPRPSDEMLIDTYLRPKIEGSSVPGCGRIIIHEADVYSDYPYELVSRYAPAHGTGDGDDSSIWYFLSPVRYASDNRRWRKVGADGRGVWHTEGRAKDVKGSAAGTTLQKLTYKEKTTSAIVKPGWLMTEYAVSQEHGHGGTVLCKIYRSPRGPGSDAPLRATNKGSSGCKRKADVVEHLEAPPAPSVCPRQRRTQEYQGTCEATVPAYLWTEQVHGGGPQIPQGPGGANVFTMLRDFMETDEDEMALQLPPNFDPVEYLLGKHQPGAAVPPCAAQPVECAQTTADDDVIEFTFTIEELMGSSAPDKCSGVQIKSSVFPWMTTPAPCVV